jgi:hypothetical protein
MSFNLLNWGMYGAVGSTKVERACDIIGPNPPAVLCLSEMGPEDAVEQLTRPLAEQGVHYRPVASGQPNKRGIRNCMLALDHVEVLDPRLVVPQELELPPISLTSFTMGGMKVRISREPIAALVRIHGTVMAIGFFHPKSKMPEDYRTGKQPTEVPDQSFIGACKMISSLRNFAQCLLARQWVDRFWTYNPLRSEWGVTADDVRFVVLGDWNANPQEEQRVALRGYSDVGLPASTLLIDHIAASSTDLATLNTIPWGGAPSSFDAILVDPRLAQRACSRIVDIEVRDLFGLPWEEREQVENHVFDHRPVALYWT